MIKVFSFHHWMKYSLKIRQIISRSIGYKKYNNDYDYMHDLLINLPNYSKTTINPEKLIKVSELETSKENLEIYDSSGMTYLKDSNISKHLLKHLENSERLGIISFTNVNPLINRINEISDNDLVEILLTVVGTTSSLDLKNELSKADFSFFKKLARECLYRIKHWNKTQLLLIADICFVLSGPFSTIFHPEVVKILHAKPKSLNPYQLTQSFFYASIIRHYNFAKQDDIEKQIWQSMPFIDSEELAIIALGFFKTKNKIKTPALLKKVTDTVVEHKKNISNVALNSILKILQLSFDGTNQVHVELCSRLLKELKTEIHKKDFYILVRLASLGNHLNLYENDLIQDVIEHLTPSISEMRLKELDRITFVIMNSRVSSECIQHFIQLVMEELQRSERSIEIESYFQSFGACIYYLACMGYHSPLISKVFKSSHLEGQDKHKYMNHGSSRQMYELNLMLQVEGPVKYHKYQLATHHSASLKKLFSSHIHTKHQPLTSQERLFNELHKSMLKVMKEEFLKRDFIIPTLPIPGILFCTDQKQNLRAFPHKHFNSCDVKFAPTTEEDLIFHMLLLTAPSFYIYGTNLLRGSMFTQVRLIEKLGYNVILIHRNILHLNKVEKFNQILNCLDIAINKKWKQELESNIYSLLDD